MCAHNASLAPSYPNGPTLAVLDHDWKIASIVSSVNLFAEIPDSSMQSFFGANTLKYRIFEKSSPMRHATELHIKEMNNSIPQLSKEILLLVTDGGGDHNVTHASVQASLIALFLQFNTDMLVAM